ncbi:TPA: hypothetical protein R1902_000421 [Staphylococcus delphini]|nr:hypothetical protein [Staphylococcus delphini]HEC2167996.1 hypothetical protein [Staphylococcus delphini]HEC2180633.1 hypothetical protein [Staphylococcus delphini]HEC2188389.1 hypothetical protein [Staphylococcus delphini]HEC2190418.1 hypothetical protein [Staphylococcus delphini]
MISIYIDFWKNIFNYSRITRLLHLFLNMMVNVIVLLFILIIGILVPIHLESSIVGIYDTVLFLMFFPTVSCLVRVFRGILKNGE